MNSEKLHYFGVYTAAIDFTRDACWFLFLKSLLIKNNKKREAALRNEAGGDEKHVFFLLFTSLKKTAKPPRKGEKFTARYR